MMGLMDVHPGTPGQRPRKPAPLAGLQRVGGLLEAGPQEQGHRYKAPAKLNIDFIT